MKSPAAPAFERPASTPSISPSPEVLIAVAEVGRELAASGELEARLGGALRVLERRLGAGRSVVYSANAGTRSLTVDASHGLDPDAFRPRYSAGAAGRVAATGQPVVVPVLRHDPMALSEIADLTRWSDSGWNLVAVPVIARGRCVGVLCAYFRHRDPAGFAERLGVLDVVAGLIGKTLQGDEKRPASDPAVIETPALGPAATQFEYSNMIGEVIHRNAHAQTKIIEDILDVSRIVTGQLRLELRATDLSLVIQDAMEVTRPAAVARRVAVRYTSPDGPATVIGDPERLQQVRPRTPAARIRSARSPPASQRI